MSHVTGLFISLQNGEIRQNYSLLVCLIIFCHSFNIYDLKNATYIFSRTCLLASSRSAEIRAQQRL